MAVEAGEVGRLTLTGRQGRWVVAAAVLGSALASIDATVVGIALPALGRAFDADLAALQWVVNGYALALAGLLLVGGSLGDRYGRRRVFAVGVVWFALMSLVCGLAPNVEILVAARALQGVGAALLTPASLAILQASFDEADRGRAIGAWTGLGGVATAAGPFLGGWLIEAFSWRLIFLINLPLAAVVVAVAARHVPESHNPDVRGRPDLLGGALVTAGLVGVVFALIDGPASGWTSAPVLVGLVGGVALLAGFVAREHRAADPVVPLEMFASRQFTAANAVTFLQYAALGGALFLLPIQLQQVSGFSPLAAGTALLPVTVMMLLFSARAGALATRIGPRLPMTVGPVVAGAGLLLVTRAGPDAFYLTDVLPGALVLGLGLATCVAPLTSTTLAAVPAHHAGAASAVNNDVARTGGLVAVAVLPALAGLGGAAYLDPGLFDRGFRRAMVISALVCAAGGLVAALGIRNPRRPATELPAAERASARIGRQAAERVCCPLDAPGLRATPGPGSPAGPPAVPGGPTG